VSDNGRGIKPEEIANPASLGLVGMRERVVHFGGSLEIDGAPGRGTRLKIEIPFAVTKEYSLR